jgi:cyclase
VAAGADAVLAASLFHFGTASIGQVKDTLAQAGHRVRPVPSPRIPDDSNR